MAGGGSYHFRVAFSFAGEQIGRVEQIARGVRAELGDDAVFFYPWYQHLIAGQDGNLRLQQLYREQCDLCVVCISGEYGSKGWPQAEHRALLAQLLHIPLDDERAMRYLPIRFADGDVPGVLETAIVPDIRGMTDEQVVRLIIERLGLVPTKVRSSADAAAAPPASMVADWPAATASFQWPMADHVAAQHAFVRLVEPDSPVRVLRIEGESETGKTHLAGAIESNLAACLPSVRCAMFTFTAGLDPNEEMRSFARLLGINIDVSGSVGAGFTAILVALEAEPRPTLLVFDTYEQAGAAVAFVEKVLLPSLVINTWLRVVILGQTVPDRSGTRWAGLATEILELEVPAPEDWFAFARTEGTETTLEFVREAYVLASRKPPVLDGLLRNRKRN